MWCMSLLGVLRLPCVVLPCVVADFGAHSLFLSRGLNVVRQLGTPNTSLLHTGFPTVAVALPGPWLPNLRGVAVFHSPYGFRVVPMWFGGVFSPLLCAGVSSVFLLSVFSPALSVLFQGLGWNLVHQPGQFSMGLLLTCGRSPSAVVAAVACVRRGIFLLLCCVAVVSFPRSRCASVSVFVCFLRSR